MRPRSRIPAGIIICVDHNYLISECCRRHGAHRVDRARPVMVVLTSKYQGRLGPARNSAAEIACDIMETDWRPPQKSTVFGTQLLRGE